MGKLIPFLGLSLVILVLVACGGAATSAPTTAPVAQVDPTTVPTAAKVLHFYSVNAATGQSAPYGLKAIQEEQLLAEKINSEGGFTDSCGNNYTIEITVFDMANSREQAVAGIRKAADDPTVLGVLGPDPDVGILPMIPVAGELKMPMVIPSSGSTIENWNPYVFRIHADSLTVIPVYLQVLQEKVGMERMAILYDISQDAQRFEAETIRDAADDVGFEMVAFEAYRVGDTDFRAQLTKIKAAEPDFIHIDAGLAEMHLVVNQLHELDIEANVAISFGSQLDPSAWDLTEGKVKGTFFWAPALPTENVEESNIPESLTLYKEKYGEIPTIWGIFGWDVLNVSLDAVRRICSNTDREAFRDALADVKDFPLATSGVVNWKSPRDAPFGDNLTPNVDVGVLTGRGTAELLKETTTATSGEVEELHFYSVNAATGQSGPYGLPAIQEQQLLAEKINSEGGFTDNCGSRYTVKITVFDMANSREQAVAGIRKAADDSTVLGVLGPDPDVGWLPMLPVAGELKMPLVIPSDGSRVEKWNPYTFRIHTDAVAGTSLFLKEITEKIGVQRMAIIYDITQDSQRFIAETIRDLADEAGFEVVAFEAFRVGDNDFRAQLTKIESANPDWIEIDAALPEMVKIVNQMADLGIEGKNMSVSYGTQTDASAWDLTEGKVEGSYFWAPALPTENFEESNIPESLSLFKEKYGDIPIIWGVFGWDVLNVSVDAVKRACTNTDREKFRDALADVKDFPLATSGTVTWQNPRDNPNGDNLTPSVVIGVLVGRAQPEVLK